MSKYQLTPQDLIEIIRHPSPSMIRHWQCQTTHQDAFRDLAEQLQGVVDAWKEENILRTADQVVFYDLAEQAAADQYFYQEMLESQREHLMNVEKPEDYIYVPPHEKDSQL